MNMTKTIKNAQTESAEVAREIHLQLGDEISIGSYAYIITEISDHHVGGCMISEFGRFVESAYVHNLDLRRYGIRWTKLT